MDEKYEWSWNKGNPRLLLNGHPIALLRSSATVHNGWYVETVDGTQNRNAAIATIQDAINYTESLFSIRRTGADKREVVEKKSA